MAGPPNPFAGLAQAQNQRNGTSNRGGRGGRGRPSPFQPKNPNAPPFTTPTAPSAGDNKPRGRGRGRATSTRGFTRGRGGPTGHVNASRNKPESNGASESPFAQPKSDKWIAPPAPALSPFGVQTSQTKSPFSSNGSFGGPGFGGFGSQQAVTTKKPVVNGATGAVPVEDASVLSGYTERYEQLKLDRAKERELAIKKGLMADPNQPTSLNQAITPVGTCTSMCPDFERVERIVQKMVDKSEKFLHPATNSLQYMETKMLKRFRRSAAGYDEQLPSDIRTPNTLLQTTNYLIRHVVGGPEPLGLIHKFVWDRTRSIRNDLSVQQLTQEDHVRTAVTCLERIARFHILSLHLLSSPANEEPFDRHQEREQLNNTMLSLMYYYDDNRGRISFANEDEFRAYYIIFSIMDQRPDLEARVQKWPAELRNSNRVQAALELFAAAGNTWDYQGTLDSRRPNAIAQGFYARFFKIVDSPAVSYLMACVAEIYFNHVRQTAIRSIWKGYCRYPASQQHKNEEWTIDELTTVLCFDDDEQTRTYCESQGLHFAENADGNLYLNWGSDPIESVAFQPSSDHSFSETYVESKRAGRSLVAIILGLSIKEAASMGMIDSSVLPQRSLALPAPTGPSTTEDDSLFVSDDENEIPAPSFTVPSDKPPAFAPSPFGGFPPKANEPPAAAASQTSNPFPSSFSGGFGQAPAAPTSTTPAVSAPASSNPFASSLSTFKPTPAAPAAPNPFAHNPSPFTPTTSATTTPAAPNPFASTPFAPPNVETGVTQAPGPFSLSSLSPEKQTSIFDTAQNPFATKPAAPATTTPEVKFPSFSASGPSPFNISQTSTSSESTTSAFPGTSQLAPASSPFSIFKAPTSTEQTPGVAAGQPPKSVFDTAKPSSFSGSTNSLFNLPGPSAAPKEPSTQAQTNVSKPAQETPSLLAPKENAPSIFSPIKPAATITPASSIFAPKESATPMERPSVTEESTAAEPAETALKPIDLAPPAEPERAPSVSGSVKESATTLPPAPVQPEEPTTKLAEPAADEEASIVSDAAEKRDAWLKTLQEAASRRRGEPSSRKRVLEEPEEPRPTSSGPKASKIFKSEEPTPRKTSMALSSIKPLPTLPILEQVKSTTARKPVEPEPELKYNKIDEDELLLSAARIAAESLRSGPRLSDSWPGYYNHNHTERPRSSFSPASSFSSSMPPLSGSQSPSYSSHHHVNGHDLALAPDADLGLGRSLSRTEQRLRLTGGKGLAYKPLDFTPEKKRKSLER
ncbi:putative leucine permease transcriptional regulator (SAC3) [Aspergillus glaucus CBS 516.65]|uniref:SAC3/GANP/THP3 conserved domain-containing protein n=1 Tax=Aspergillus glaucus CBS 516.65 TaxID=1160497 RepID=A0A1L9V8P5_ASPGL|nr:hypothetical protein ASPGLDRAFT_39245 [Aspergillus glaucus CBS 516.65]OJJ80249.1 hypothetical protein ASPGLDRAFT_39245 [Aspergillus glaucus CBS 516.65]